MIVLSQKEQAMLQQVQAFARDTVAPAAASWTRGKSPNPEILTAAADLGLLRLQVPVEDGGLGASFSLKAATCQALAAADFGLAMSIVNTHNVAAKLALHGSAGLKKRHLPALLWGQEHAWYRADRTRDWLRCCRNADPRGRNCRRLDPGW